MKKAILAFSGGLDTTFCIPFLKDEGYEVIAVTVDTGGLSEPEGELEDRALSLGAEEYVFLDRKQTFYGEFVSYVIKGNVLRGGVYPLCAGPERYLIAKELVRVAHEHEAGTIVHGSTGAGNDQVRFDVTIQQFDPSIEILAPVRDRGLTRAEEHEYLKEKGFPVEETDEKYSINKGMLGTTIGGEETKSSWKTIPEHVWPSVVSPEDAPKDGETIDIEFRNGLPVSLNDEDLNGPELLQKLHSIGAKNGYGRGIHIGDTILGLKGRIAFEAPGPLALIEAHSELEKITLTRNQLRTKKTISERYGDLLHEGHYFDPVMRDCESFLDSTQKHVNGAVRLTVQSGALQVEGVDSPDSMMNRNIGVYGEENHLWNGRDAQGFCNLYGIQEIIANQRND